MKIIYCHHGQRLKGNPPTQDDKLTELGIKDCYMVSELFDGKFKEKLKAIYTSTFYRCTKTAELVNTRLNLPIILDERLNEYRSVENETWTDLQNRVINCINDIIDKYEDDDAVICVTSGVNIGAFICKAFNLPASEDTPFLGVSNCSPIIFDYKK